MKKNNETGSAGPARWSEWLGHVNECKLDDLIRWRRQHDNHNQAGNLVGCQAHGLNSGNVEKPAQMAAQLLAGGSELKRYRLCGVTITTRADETPLHKQISQALKFLLRCVISHKRAKWPNAGTQRPGTKDATIANPDALPGSLK